MKKDFCSINELFNFGYADEGEYPLNIDVKRIIPERRELFYGPGIYVLTYHRVPTYIGKYQPDGRGDVANERWVKHLQGNTMRGSKVGFGKGDSEHKSSSLLALMNDEMAAAFDSVFSDRRQLVMRDTGCVTTRNRIRFSSENWKAFSARDCDAEKIFENHEIHYVQFSGSSDERSRDEQVTAVEAGLLRKYQPMCNKEYIPDVANRTEITLTDIIQEIYSLAENNELGVERYLAVSGTTVETFEEFDDSTGVEGFGEGYSESEITRIVNSVIGEVTIPVGEKIKDNELDFPAYQLTYNAMEILRKNEQRVSLKMVHLLAKMMGDCLDIHYGDRRTRDALDGSAGKAFRGLLAQQGVRLVRRDGEYFAECMEGTNSVAL